jgi:hypothetical protein
VSFFHYIVSLTVSGTTMVCWDMLCVSMLCVVHCLLGDPTCGLITMIGPNQASCV